MRKTKLPRAGAGFTLVELMVGIVIALIASLAIVQAFSTYDNQKRSTTAGAEAQENGLMALTQIEQDVHNAGAGVVDVNTLECSTLFTYLDGPGGGGGPIPNFSLSPITIRDGGATGSDQVTVRIGSNFLGSLPATITKPMPDASAEFNVNNPGVFRVGDLGLVMQAGNCMVMNITAVQIAARKIQHNRGSGAPNNPAANYIKNQNWPGYTTGAIVKSLGAITARTYSISGNSLQLVETNVASNVPGPTLVLAKDIVSLQAQYGVAPANSQIVDTWVDATGSWANPTAADIKRIKAVRIAVIARSGKRESVDVTEECGNNAGTNKGPCAWEDTAANPAPKIDLSGTADWARYRYKVYQTIIPLRNVIWAEV